MKNIILLGNQNNYKPCSEKGGIYFKICLPFTYLTIFNINNICNNSNIKQLTYKKEVGKICLPLAYLLPTFAYLRNLFSRINLKSAYLFAFFAYLFSCLPTFYKIYTINNQYQFTEVGRIWAGRQKKYIPLLKQTY